MHNPTSVRENGTYKLHWDFHIKIDHLISAQMKKTFTMVDSVVSANLRVKLNKMKND